MHERIDVGFARLMAMLAGGKAPVDFLPQWSQNEEQNEARMLGALVSLKERLEGG